MGDEPDLASLLEWTTCPTSEERDHSFLVEKMAPMALQVALVESRSAPMGSRRSDRFLPKKGTMPRATDYQMAVDFVRCDSPDAVYVRPCVYRHVYNKLHALLATLYERPSSKLARRKFDVGFPCAIRVAATGRWVRGAVADISATDADAVTVRCWDDAEEYTVAADEVLPLEPTLHHAPKMVLCCSLAGLYPSLGLTWNQRVASMISDALTAAEEVVIFVERRPHCLAAPMAAQFAFKFDSEGGPLEIPGKSLANLNQHLVDLGVASYVLSTGLVPRQWPTLPPVPMPDCFVAHVTWLNLEGSIFLNNVDHSEMRLMEMRRSFNVTFEGTSAKKSDLNCSPGDLCIARLVVGFLSFLFHDLFVLGQLHFTTFHSVSFKPL